MALFAAGVATIIQTVGFGKVGSRLPIIQGTSFAFIPIMLPANMANTCWIPKGIDWFSGSFLFGLPPPPDFLRDLAINPSQLENSIKIEEKWKAFTN